MEKSAYSIVLTVLLVASSAAAADAGGGVAGPAPMPTELYMGPDSPLPVWVDASAVFDEHGNLRSELFGDEATDLARQLGESGESCLEFENAHISYAQPPPRGSLDQAVEHSRTRLLAEVTNKAFGIYSGFIPGQLLQVVPLKAFGEPLPAKHYYFFIPMGRFPLGQRLICKQDASYAEPPEVGGKVFLFIAGVPRGRDENLLVVYGPGDIVPVGRDGSLWLPKHYAQPQGAVEKSSGPTSKDELLNRLEEALPERGRAMKPAGWTWVLLALVLEPVSSVLGQCVPSYNTGFGPDYVYLYGDAAMNGQSPNAVANAVYSWKGCYSPGSQMGFPIPSGNPVSGASYASLTVKYVSGFNPTNDQSCGEFNGNTIKIFQKAKSPSNTVVYCSTYGYSSLIAHELGHFYGLTDIYTSGCTGIMAQADGLTHSVTSQDCVAAKASKVTPSENQPVHPACTEPCAGTCMVDGHCQATYQTSPIVIALRGNHFSLSGPEDPVLFDIWNDGEPVWMGWTAAGGETAFLAVDLNGNGTIDSGAELFGNSTLLPDGCVALNGYVALAPYDSQALGGNGNLEIDAGDAIFPSLRLWLDDDHDGVSDVGELMSLAEAGITGIGLDYHVDQRIDRFGNHFWLRGSATRVGPNGQVEHPLVIYDVYFVGE